MLFRENARDRQWLSCMYAYTGLIFHICARDTAPPGSRSSTNLLIRSHQHELARVKGHLVVTVRTYLVCAGAMINLSRESWIFLWKRKRNEATSDFFVSYPFIEADVRLLVWYIYTVQLYDIIPETYHTYNTVVWHYHRLKLQYLLLFIIGTKVSSVWCAVCNRLGTLALISDDDWRSKKDRSKPKLPRGCSIWQSKSSLVNIWLPKKVEKYQSLLAERCRCASLTFSEASKRSCLSMLVFAVRP